jgi:hypothetical protein
MVLGVRAGGRKFISLLNSILIVGGPCSSPEVCLYEGETAARSNSENAGREAGVTKERRKRRQPPSRETFCCQRDLCHWLRGTPGLRPDLGYTDCVGGVRAGPVPEKEFLEKLESHLDFSPGGYGFTIRPDCRLESPGSQYLDCLFVQAQSEAF